MTKIKKIEGFNGYFVTDSGKVLSEYKGNFKWLVASKNKGGYTQVTLRKKGKRYTKLLHRLVAEAYIPNTDNKPCVDHINGVRHDNGVCNLRWCTQQENMSFPLARKHNSEAKKGKIFSEEHKQKISEKLSEIRKGENNPMYGKPKPEGSGKQPKQVIQYTKNGEYITIYNSVSEASRKTGINHGNISLVCNGKHNIAGGYKWAYLN